MATQTFAPPLPKVATGMCMMSGGWNNPTTFSGRSGMRQSGANSQIDTIVTGTQLEMQCYYPNTTTFQVSVDGGSYTTITNNGGTWAYVTVFTGLSDTAHTVTIRQLSGVSQVFYLDATTAFRVTGSAPAMAYPTGFGTQVDLMETEGLKYIIREGNVSNGTSNGYSSPLPPTLTTLYQDIVFRFRAKVSGLSIWMLQNGHVFRYTMDGVLQGSLVTAASTNQYGWLTIATGLDATEEHEYEIIASGKAGSVSTTIYIQGIMFAGGSLVERRLHTRERVGFYGDSITSAYEQIGDSTLGYAWLAGDAMGKAVYNLGLAGTTVKTAAAGTDATYSGQARAAGLATISPAFSDLVIEYGTNDVSGLDGAITTGQFQTAYLDMLTTIRAGCPDTKIWCMTILPRTDDASYNRSGFNTALRAAVAAMNDSAIVVLDAEDWIDVNTDLLDSKHPNALGYIKIAQQLVRAIAAPRTGGAFDLAVAAREGDMFLITASMSASSGTIKYTVPPTFTVIDSEGLPVLDYALPAPVDIYDSSAATAITCETQVDLSGMRGNYIARIEQIGLASDGELRILQSNALLSVK